MAIDPNSIYRERIYTNYVTARDQPIVLDSVDVLSARIFYFNKIIRKHFPPDMNTSIFELGCGHGAFIYALQQAGYHNAKGVDVSPEQVAASRHFGIEGVSEGDVMSTLRKMPGDSQNVIIAFDLIEHFTKSELIELIDEVHRVLKPGGRWIIHVPNGESPFVGRMRYGDFTHELAFTRFSLAQLFLSSGFNDVACFEDRPEPHGLKSLVRAGFWWIIRTGLLFYLAVETGSYDRKAIFSQNLLAVATRGT